MINVFISDDHHLVLEGLTSMLSTIPDFNVVGSAASGTETISSLEGLNVDVLITDWQMPGMDGLELIKKVKKIYPKIKILVLSMNEDTAIIKNLLQAGAAGYLLKKSRKAEFILAIQKVYQGEKYFSSEIAYEIINSLHNPFINKEQLSAQELQVARMLAKGMNAPEIADKLNLSLNTIHTYRKRIYSKLNINSIAELVRFGVEKGWD